MLLVVAILFSVACVAASFRRLAIAIAPTWLDPRVLIEHLRGERGGERFAEVARAARVVTQASWEASLFEALEHAPPARDAMVNEQLTEIDHDAQRMVRVPRVCASLCTSAAFLLAALSMRSSLGDPAVFAEATRDQALRDAVTNAIDIGAIGVCGTAFCIAILMRAKRAARAKQDEIDQLVDRLEALAPRRS